MTDMMQYGPQTAEVEALLERLRTLTDAEAKALGAARDAERYAAWDAALDVAWDAAWYAVRAAAWDAALALVARDLITDAGFTQEHYDLLTGPWRQVVGRVHPDDAEMVAA